MHYVYLIESTATPKHRYVGLTSDLRRRLADHNGGKSTHTSKFKPWRLVTYLAFSDRAKAESFERYLKSGSGHAFANRRLWYFQGARPRLLRGRLSATEDPAGIGCRGIALPSGNMEAPSLYGAQHQKR